MNNDIHVTITPDGKIRITVVRVDGTALEVAGFHVDFTADETRLVISGLKSRLGELAHVK